MRIKILIYITPPVVDIKTISWKIIIDIGNIGGIKWWNFNFYSGLFFQNLKSLLSFLFYALPIKEKNFKKYIAIESLHCGNLRDHFHRMHSKIFVELENEFSYGPLRGFLTTWGN